MVFGFPRFTDDGFFQFFTKYTGVRQLYFETSKDGVNWTDDKLLAATSPVNTDQIWFLNS